MFQSIKNWWNRDKIATENLLSRIENIQNAVDMERSAREAAERLIEQEREMRREAEERLADVTAEDEERRSSTTPWVEIKSADYSEVKGINIQLDWNEAFIQHLKDSGLTGRDEDAIVQKWLAFMYQGLVERFEHQAIENSDRPRIRDYE